MKKSRIAINGFGRIGRMVFRQAMKDEQLDVIAINAKYPPETLAHLIKYDSVHGQFSGKVEADTNHLQIDGKKVQIVNEREPDKLPWQTLEIDIVVEATGKFNSRAGAGLHLQAGAEKVVVTAPGEDMDRTIVMGVNEASYRPSCDHVISNASCTTNCLAPVVKVLDDCFSVENGLMTTVHAFTNDQKSTDSPHKDLRRARGCTQSIIPTSTGAARAIADVIPHLRGKLHGMALRVPTPDVSLIDLVVDVGRPVTVQEVNDAFLREAEKQPYIMKYSTEPLVSIDYTSTDYSCIIDGLSTMVLDETKVKILAWYDNEWGYSRRVLDLTKFVGGTLERKQMKIS